MNKQNFLTCLINDHVSNFCEKVGLWTNTDGYFAWMTMVIHVTTRGLNVLGVIWSS